MDHFSRAYSPHTLRYIVIMRTVLSILALALVGHCRGEEQKQPSTIEHGLVISATDLTRSQSGWELRVEFGPRNGFVPQTMLLSAGPNEEDTYFLRQGPYRGPLSVKFELECNLGPGKIDVDLNGFDSERNFAYSTKSVVLEAPGKLMKLEAQQSSLLFLDTTKEQYLKILGWYGICDLARDVTTDGTSLTALDDSVVEIDPDGRVTARKIGRTEIEARKDALATRIEVIVEGLWPER